MNYKYYEGGCTIKFKDKEERLQTILKYDYEKESDIEVHIIKDPFPEISIDSIIDKEGDFIIIEDTPQQEISEEDYTNLKNRSKRCKKF